MSSERMSDKGEALQVFLRVRPPIFKEVKQENAVMVRGTQSVTLLDDKKETTCSYDYVFNEVSEQQHVFERIKPLLEDVLSGVNACIFAYGQTSAGKSYTMIGPNGGQNIFSRDIEEWGIIPRASEFLLGYLNERAMEGLLSYEVKASFLQIYNENLYDLLRDTGPMIDDKLAQTGGGSEKETDLRIREVPKRKGKDGISTSEVFVSGLSEFRVQTSEDILRILAVGTNNRMTRSTDFNATSSRSHALLQLTFEIEAQTETGQRVISRSKLNLVDLAGSEKIPFVASDFNNAKHMKELTSINKSLSSLGNVIQALSSNNRSHIPYRDSKLTRILQDSLSGNTRTILVACVAPTVLHTSETLSTLQFADRAKNVILSVKANQLVDDKFLLTKAHGEITRLKTLLAHALKQLDAKNRGEGGVDPSELMRLQEENETLRRDNAALKKSSQQQQQHLPPLQNHSPTPFESTQQQFNQQQQQQSMQNQLPVHLPHINTSQQQQPQAPMGQPNLPYLNYSATNPSLAPSQQNPFQPMQQQNGANGMYNMGHMSVDSLMKQPPMLAKNWEGAGRFSLDHEKENKKKKAKVRNVPPLFDLLESARSLHKKGNKKESMQSASKIHAKVYKSINDRQIDELNSMLSGANLQSNLQQQQTMVQYLQQQQFLQQNFPHQQLSMPGQPQQPPQQPPQGYPASLQLQQPPSMPQMQMQPQYQMSPMNQSQYPPQQQQQQQPVLQTYAPSPSHAQMMDSINTLAASIMQPQSYNTAATQAHGTPHRPAPVHQGAPQYPVPSAQVYETTNDPEFLRQSPPASPAPAAAVPATPAKANEDVDPAVPEKETKDRSHRKKDKDKSRHRDRDSSRERRESSNNIPASEEPPRQHTQEVPGMLSGRSAADSSYNVMESGRLSTGQTQGLTTPGSNTNSFSSAAKVPANRIMRKGNQSNASSFANANASTHDLVAANILASGMYNAQQTPNGQSQHAFMASLLNKQTQNGPASALMPQSSGDASNRPVNLSQSHEDIGRALYVFSFRMNTWDRVDLIDYDSVKRLHKCKSPDGSIQWLDLTKKPLRSIA